jgi:hypothetical protein
LPEAGLPTIHQAAVDAPSPGRSATLALCD